MFLLTIKDQSIFLKIKKYFTYTSYFKLIYDLFMPCKFIKKRTNRVLHHTDNNLAQKLPNLSIFETKPLDIL